MTEYRSSLSLLAWRWRLRLREERSWRYHRERFGDATTALVRRRTVAAYRATRRAIVNNLFYHTPEIYVRGGLSGFLNGNEDN